MRRSEGLVLAGPFEDRQPEPGAEGPPRTLHVVLRWSRRSRCGSSDQFVATTSSWFVERATERHCASSSSTKRFFSSILATVSEPSGRRTGGLALSASLRPAL